jgi:zinc transporter ZupT
VRESERMSLVVALEKFLAMIYLGQQLQFVSCHVMNRDFLKLDVNTSTLGTTSLSLGAAWGYSILSIGVISLLSLLLAMLILLIPPKGTLMNLSMSFILSLGTGVLVGDAILHLIPEFMSDEHSEVSMQDHRSDVLWQGCVTCLGIYVFFLVEKLLHTFTGHSHLTHTTHVHIAHDDRSCGHYDAGLAISRRHEELSLSEMEKTMPTEDICHHQHSKECQVTSVSEDNSTHHDRNPLDIPPSSSKKSKVRPMGWLIIFGDSLHNFIDGLAVAASFSTNALLGLSTSLTILLHEIPHELADFAILITAGMSRKNIILYNLLTTFTAFLGVIVGMTASSASSFQLYVFALTAATFLYIALANIIPELVHTNLKFVFILLESFGILVGFLIMLLIALYGEHIIS